MVRLLIILLFLPLFSCAQIGSIKTEKFKAKFETGISIEYDKNYNDNIKVPIQLLKIIFN
jgi:hypothetical protein